MKPGVEVSKYPFTFVLQALGTVAPELMPVNIGLQLLVDRLNTYSREQDKLQAETLAKVDDLQAAVTQVRAELAKMIG